MNDKLPRKIDSEEETKKVRERFPNLTSYHDTRMTLLPSTVETRKHSNYSLDWHSSHQASPQFHNSEVYSLGKFGAR